MAAGRAACAWDGRATARGLDHFHERPVHSARSRRDRV